MHVVEAGLTVVANIADGDTHSVAAYSEKTTSLSPQSDRRAGVQRQQISIRPRRQKAGQSSCHVGGLLASDFYKEVD